MALVTLGLGLSAPAGSAQASPAPYSAHSMVYAYGMPFAQKERVFVEAKAMGASHIRLDIEMHAVFRRWGNGDVVHRNWAGVDEVVTLSRRYGLPVVAILIGVPEFLSVCDDDEAQRCAARDPAAYGGYAGEVAEHTRGAIGLFEIINEPDSGRMFRGTPEAYARMLAAAHDAIKARSPSSRVVLGGVSGIDARDWLARVFATPGAAAATKFDIANVHLRGSVGSLGHVLALWREHFDSKGRADAPLWVTEHGYPADTAYQDDPRYRGGEAAQAAFIRDSLPTLVRAGTAQVFVSTRDTWPHEFGPQSPYNSEGVARLSLEAPYSVQRRPAAGVVRWLANQWPEVPRTVGEEARLTSARNVNAMACFSLARTRDELIRRESDDRATIARLRRRVRPARRARRPRQVAPLRRELRGSLRRLGTVKRMRASASARTATRCLQLGVYQAQLDAGP